jgi:hypothetical protein
MQVMPKSDLKPPLIYNNYISLEMVVLFPSNCLQAVTTNKYQHILFSFSFCAYHYNFVMKIKNNVTNIFMEYACHKNIFSNKQKWLTKYYHGSE